MKPSNRFCAAATRRALGALAGAILLCPGHAICQEVESNRAPPPPFAERSLHILHVPLLDFAPAESGAPPPRSLEWKLGAAWANTYSTTWHARRIHLDARYRGGPFTQAEALDIHQRFGGDTVLFVNGEVLRTRLGARVGLTRSLSASVEVPYITHGLSGLDSFTRGFHDVFGADQNGRDEFPGGRFTVMLQKPGGPMTLLDFRPRSGWSDVSATLSWRASRARGGWTYGGDLAVKAPTGESRDFNGSGSWDCGIRAFAARHRGKWSLQAEASVVLPGKWKAPLPLETSAAARALLSAIRDLGATTRVGVSLIGGQSPFRSGRYATLSETGAEVGLGVEQDVTPRLSARLTLREHIATAGDRADFGVGLSARYRP